MHWPAFIDAANFIAYLNGLKPALNARNSLYNRNVGSLFDFVWN